MVACRYYAQGRCKFGDQCRFEHIDPPSGGGGGGAGGGGVPSDPFAPAAPPRPPKHNATFGGNEHPVWPFTAIALPDPASGNALAADMSAEEVRVNAYANAPRGRSEAVVQREAAMLNEYQARAAAVTAAPPPASDPFASAASARTPFNSAPTPFSSAPAQTIKDPFANAGGFRGAQQQAQPQPQGMFDTPAAPAAPFGTPARAPALGQAMATPFGTAAPVNAPAPVGALAPAETQISAEAEKQYMAAQFGFQKVPETAPPARFY